MKTFRGISVIICCYNSEKRITQTLAYLERQEAAFPWELVVVDNNCIDNTVAEVESIVSRSEQLKGVTKIVSECKAGLNYARLKGMEESNYEFVLFCDDDNWLNKHYLQRSFDFLVNNPDYGIVGGNGIEKCETEPPYWFENHKSIYAIGCRKDGQVHNVYGAGMLLRKNLIDGANFAMSDRKGDSLASGGDSEICQIVRDKGYKIRQLCSNTFFHYLPKERLTYNYIMRMAKASGQTKAELYLLKNNKWKGIGYRLKTDLRELAEKFFKSNYFSFKYSFYRVTSYWHTRFIKA